MAASGSPPQSCRWLLEKLHTSNQRFAKIMGTLVAKYDRPFEEDSLVHIATLTYETPQGLKRWGGGIVTQEISRNIQTLKKESYNTDEIWQRSFTDVKSNGVDVTLVQRNGNTSRKNDSLQSLQGNELGTMHMARVDVILEDDHPRLIMFDSFGKRKDRNTPTVLSTDGSSKASLDYGSPWKVPTSLLQGTQGLEIVTAGTQDQSFVARWANTTFEDEASVQDITLSDIYAEMLYSLWRRLPSQKMGLVSTKKYLSKGWFRKKRRLNITLAVESSFFKISEKFQIVPGEKNSLRCRKDYKPRFLPCPEPGTAVQGIELLTADPTCSKNAFSPTALRRALPVISTQESPSRTTVGKQGAPNPSESCPRSQALVAPSSSLPPFLTNAKDRFHYVPLRARKGAMLLQERRLYQSFVMQGVLQMSKSSPLSQDRLCLEHSPDASGTGPKTAVPQEKVTKARKCLPFGMEQSPCKAPDVIDSIFDTYSQETTQWAQELLFLKRSGQKSRAVAQSKCGDSVGSLEPCDGLQRPQKVASPLDIAKSSLCKAVAELHCRASPLPNPKGNFSSSTKRRKMSSSQIGDCFSSPKKATLDVKCRPIVSGDSPHSMFRDSRTSSACPSPQGITLRSPAKEQVLKKPTGSFP